MDLASPSSGRRWPSSEGEHAEASPEVGDATVDRGPRRFGGGGLRPGPGRPELAGRGAGLRQLLAARPRGAPAVAGLRGAGRAQARRPWPRRRLRRALERLRLRHLARLHSGDAFFLFGQVQPPLPPQGILRGQNSPLRAEGQGQRPTAGAEVQMPGANEHNGGRKGRRPLPRPGAGTTEMEAHGSPAEMEAHGSPAAWSTRKRSRRASSTSGTGTRKSSAELRRASRKSSAERRRRLGPAEDNRAGPLLPLACTSRYLARGRAARSDGGRRTAGEQRTEDGGRRESGGRRRGRRTADGEEEEGRRTARRKKDGGRRRRSWDFCLFELQDGSVTFLIVRGFSVKCKLYYG